MRYACTVELHITVNNVKILSILWQQCLPVKYPKIVPDLNQMWKFLEIFL